MLECFTFDVLFHRSIQEQTFLSLRFFMFQVTHSNVHCRTEKKAAACLSCSYRFCLSHNVSCILRNFFFSVLSHTLDHFNCHILKFFYLHTFLVFFFLSVAGILGRRNSSDRFPTPISICWSRGLQLYWCTSTRQPQACLHGLKLTQNSPNNRQLRFSL